MFHFNDELFPNLSKNPPYNKQNMNTFSLPIREGGLNVRKFEDRFKTLNDPIKSQVPHLYLCKQNLIVAHAVYCSKGEYTHMRHIEIRDSFANYLSDGCHDVEI